MNVNKKMVVAGVVLLLIAAAVLFVMSDAPVVQGFKYSTGIGVVHVTITGYNETWGTTYTEQLTVIPGQEGLFVPVQNNTAGYKITIT